MLIFPMCIFRSYRLSFMLKLFVVLVTMSIMICWLGVNLYGIIIVCTFISFVYTIAIINFILILVGLSLLYLFEEIE